MSYQPLAGAKVLDLGILIPAALTSGKLAALGADVVKLEQPPNGDRMRVVPPIGNDGDSPQHMHHTGERAGARLAKPPGMDQHHKEVLRAWLG